MSGKCNKGGRGGGGVGGDRRGRYIVQTLSKVLIFFNEFNR